MKQAMSGETIHKYAQSDTPEQVNVPPTWPGLITWAIGRYGVHAVMLAVIGYWGSMALDKVYADLQNNNTRVVVLMENRAIADAKLADAMNQSTAARLASDGRLIETLSNLTKVVEEIRREAEQAHNRAMNPR